MYVIHFPFLSSSPPLPSLHFTSISRNLSFVHPKFLANHTQQIALQNFLHDIEFSIVEPFLQSSDGPLLGLSVEYILKLNEREVEEFGGEDKTVVEQRKEANANIEKLSKAVQIAAEAWSKSREIERVGG
jgi:hypothetical protein